MRLIQWRCQGSTRRRGGVAGILASLVLAWILPGTSLATAQEAQWIWSPEHAKDRVPRTSCHFRKVIPTRSAESGQVTITADDAYELYVNGRLVGRGNSRKKMDEYDITSFLSSSGANTVAIKVTNERGSTAALAARVMLRDGRGKWRSYSTDKTWKTNLRPFPLWNTGLYNDSRWPTAQAFGKLGDTPPWDLEAEVAKEDREKSERFQISREFAVRRILEGDSTGSLIAMTFNEFGHILVSQENGPLLLIHDSKDKKAAPLSQVRTYCDKVKNCQGLLALNGEVFVTGDGPDGQALYRLADRDRDGKLEDVRTLIRFAGEIGEHGVHGLVLGPDGWLYVIVGNHTQPVDGYAATSPYRDYYEGDLVGPRYEDPSGHANGVKAPGGVVLRTDLEGKKIELVAGGIRNAYDLAFDTEGELFVHDSDMENDLGAPWYRPTRLYHIVGGAEYGWRSGWAKWPSYFVDSLPATLDTDRGSPTGGVVYDHYVFPKRYQNALFLADWSEGRILAVQLKAQGASYTANAEVFLQGSPLNVTDLDVGPDGALYFITGGRGTEGGLYQVSWKGKVPPQLRDLGKGISPAIRQPQLHSAWSRQKVATIKESLDADWGPMLNGVAISTENPAGYRLRALDLMQLLGPPPSIDLLLDLANDNNELVRRKSAELMGLHFNGSTREMLVRLLADRDRAVRREACESLCRAGQTAPLKAVLPLLKSDDRFEAWAARRLLERLPVDQWREEVLTTDDHRLFIQGALALMVARPDRETAWEIVARISSLLGGFVSDRDFVDMLRVTQVAMMRGELAPEELPELRDLLAEEFPAGNHTMNRELVRLLVYLQATAPFDRYFEYLESTAPDVEKLHLALQLRFLREGWTTERKLELLKQYEALQQLEGGGSYPFYIRHVERDFARQFSLEECQQVVQQGDQWPSAAVGALYNLPPQLDDATRAHLIALDGRLAANDTDHARPLRLGIVACLARNGDDVSMQYLRESWEREPERRQVIALGLAQAPAGDNWNYLVRSISTLEGPTLREVLQKLLDVPKAPAEGEFVRQLILAALKLKDDGAEDALALLEYWTGEQPADAGQPWEERVKAWQAWFAEKYPTLPEATLPQPSEQAKWKMDELLEYLTGEEVAQSSVERGAEVFVKAQCSKCHRFGSRGEAVGPELTTLSSRFMRKELLESLLFPSHVISDQYASKAVVTVDGKTYTGLVAENGDRVSVLQNNGEKVELDTEDVEETQPVKVSVMPEGLLDPLTKEEIADLFHYLGYRPVAKVAERPKDPAK